MDIEGVEPELVTLNRDRWHSRAPCSIAIPGETAGPVNIAQKLFRFDQAGPGARCLLEAVLRRGRLFW